ncbi:hypothetical protein W97_02889 [Coniosporium apollinis CBS 100218]|uniref:Phosphatidylethanolamine-binding protein n=1 Tax=Coniosporium apollinis (strain CBS 100218) TaxID=1168221 RepID=R7YPU1_CONA1|nr:uncharacterized protein W97_02889 [Coniosporium apollinis CBS 100218]EON63661.1 hypothetical protein W97_02889 [Coniosporium apollinis CBS 100218]
MRASTLSLKAATAALILASAANGQEIPPDFTISSDTQLLAAYGTPPDVTVVEPGVLLDFAIPRPTPPALGLAAIPSGTTGPYMIVMTDPDAPSPQNRSSSEILHWIQLDVALTVNLSPSGSGAAAFPYVLANTSAPLVPYAPPGPPAGSDPHRYIFFLWEQPEGFALPEGYTQFNATNRRLFNVSGFAAAAGLPEPLAANYFLCERPDNATATATATSSGVAGATSAAGSATTSSPAQFTGGAVGLSVGGAGVLGVVGALAAALL